MDSARFTSLQRGCVTVDSDTPPLGLMLYYLSVPNFVDLVELQDSPYILL
jgi:hypothetical protein